MKSTGIADQMIIGPEFEFNILNNVCYQVKSEQVSYAVDTEEAEWNSSNEYDNAGFQLPQAGGYHIDKPGDVSYDLRSRICLMLEDAGVDVKYHHHEVGGSGQMEIEVELGEMTDMADKTMIIKYMVRNAAIQDGKTATFMPKPIYGEAGNGMHVHMLLMKDGQPIFCDDNGYSGLSETAHYFIGGLLSHEKSLCAFTNPSTN